MEKFDDPFGEETKNGEERGTVTIRRLNSYDGIPVKYNGELIGRTFDGTTIHYIDDESREKIRRLILNSTNIYVSSRRTCQIVDDRITNEHTIEYSITNLT